MGFSLRGLWESADFWDKEENKRQQIARTVRSNQNTPPAQTIRNPKYGVLAESPDALREYNQGIDSETIKQNEKIRRMQRQALAGEVNKNLVKARITAMGANNNVAMNTADNALKSSGIGDDISRGVISGAVNMSPQNIVGSGLKLVGAEGIGDKLQSYGNTRDTALDARYATNQGAYQLGNFTGSMVGSLPYLGASAAVNLPRYGQIGAKVLGFGSTGLPIGANTYDQAREMGASESTARTAGVLTAGTAAVGNYLPFKAITSRFPGGVIGNIGARTLTGGVGNAAEEVTTNLIAKKTYDPQRNLMANVSQAALTGAAGTNLLGGAGDVVRVANNSKLNNPQEIKQKVQEVSNRPVQSDPEWKDYDNRVTSAIKNAATATGKLKQNYLDEAKELIRLRNRRAEQIKQGGYAKNPFGKDVADGLSKEQSEFINDYAEMLEGMSNDGGVSVRPDGTRVSSNSPFYRQVFEEKGRAPTKAEWFDEARREIESGKAAYGASEAYKELGQTKPEQDPLESLKQEVTQQTKELNKFKKQLDNLYKKNPDVLDAKATRQAGVIRSNISETELYLETLNKKIQSQPPKTTPLEALKQEAKAATNIRKPLDILKGYKIGGKDAIKPDITQITEEDGVEYYRGIKLEKTKGLSEEDAEVERTTQMVAIENKAEFTKDYMNLKDKNGDYEFVVYDKNGDVSQITLNTDGWRALFPEDWYNGTDAHRVHEASSLLNKELLNEMLVKQQGKGNNKVLVLAGGGGSGKGTASTKFNKQLKTANYPLVIDQVTGSVDKFNQKIVTPAQDAKYDDVDVVMVDRSPVGAAQNVVSRAIGLLKSGLPPRTVVLDRAIEDNINARNAMIELLKQGKKVPVIDNRGERGEERFIEDPAEALAFLQKTEYNIDAIRNEVAQEIYNGIRSGNIPANIQQGLIPKGTEIARLVELLESRGDGGRQRANDGQTENDTSILPGQVYERGAVQRGQTRSRTARNVAKPTLQDALAGKSTKIETNQQDKQGQLKPPVSQSKAQQQTSPSQQKDGDTVQADSKQQISKQANQKTQELEQNQTSGMQRGFIKTVMEDPNTPIDVKESVSSLYNVRNTKELQTKAATLVKEQPDIAEQIAKNVKDDISVAVAMELVKKHQNSGDYTRAIDLVEAVAKDLTDAGRTVQAASIYGKLTPEGILRFTQKEINNYNKLTNNNIKLTPEKAAKLKNMSQKIQDMPEGYDKEVEIAKMVAEVQRTMPATKAEKISTFQTMAQLLNPKTIIRNELGNTAFLGLENISQTVATPVDALLGLFTGKRTTSLPSAKTQVKGLIEGRKKGVSESFQGINTGATTQYDLNSVPVFRGKVLGGLEKTMGAALRGGDRSNYTAAFDDSLRSQMKLAKTKEPTPEMLEQAHHAGLYRTFQDKNVISNFFVGMKKTLNTVGFGVQGKRWGLGDLILKYPKTPANLLARGIDYSPAGFVKTMFEMTKPMFGGEFNQKSFVDSFSRATTGTAGLVGTGIILGSLGIITESPEEDKDLRDLQKESGLGGYQINLSALKRFVASGFNKDAAKLREGDTLVSYDWAQPSAIPISAGAAIGKGKDAKEGAGKSAAALAEGITTITEQPMVRGLQQFFGSNKGATGVIGDLIKDTPASFVPTLSNQIRQLTDNTNRNTYDPNTGREMLNRVLNRIPGLASNVAPRVGTLGDNRENFQNDGNNPLNVFLNPSFINKYQPDDTAKLPLGIYDRTGEKKQAPRSISTTQKVNGENLKITAQQNEDLQRYVGTETRKAFDSFMKNPAFAKLSDEEKANKMSSVITDINKAGKIKILGDEGFGTDAYKVSDLDKGVRNALKGNYKVTSSGNRGTYAEQYEDALTKFNENKNTYSKVERIKEEKNLKRLEVKTKFSEDAIDLYSLSKSEVYDFVTKDPNGQKLADELVAYGDALVEAGVNQYNKFRKKDGSISIQPSTGKSGGKGGRGGAKKSKRKYEMFGFGSPVSTTKSLREILESAKL